MELDRFLDFHRTRLEEDEVKYNLMLGILGDAPSPEIRLWTLGKSGACAVQNSGRPIVLGALDMEQCRRLADETRDLALPGVVGCDDTASWFVGRAVELGHKFDEPMPQQIHELRSSPVYPGAIGHARRVTDEDAVLFADWIYAFFNEAVPHDPKPSPERLQKLAGSGNYLFWIVDDQPVSMAGIVRRTRNAAAIAGVYTPPGLRGRGYAGSAVATLVERIFDEGKTTACLYTDMRNPFSNRCYAKIGFRPVCSSAFFGRR